MLKVKVPGSLMIMGEYSVLAMKPAIIAAVDRYIYISLELNNSNRIIINSDRFPRYESHINIIKDDSNYYYILDIIQRYKSNIGNGIYLDIKSDFSPKLGLGSSAAIIVGMLYILMLLTSYRPDKNTIFKNGLEIIHKRCGYGSGSDLLASIYGNVISFYPRNNDVSIIADSMPLSAIYSGSKTPTIDAIKYVKNNFFGNEDILNLLYETSSLITNKAIPAIKNRDYESLGYLMKIANNLVYSTLELKNNQINNIFNIIKDIDLYGSKISGSGLGDCIIALYKKKKIFDKINSKINKIGGQIIDFQISQTGIEQTL